MSKEYRITFNLSVQTPKYPTDEWADTQIALQAHDRLEDNDFIIKDTTEFPKTTLSLDMAANGDTITMQSLQLNWLLETKLILTEPERNPSILYLILKNKVQEALGDNYKNIQLTDIKAELQKWNW